jgi:hypothetical protein
MIGLNLLDQFLDNPQALLGWLATSNAGAALVMDNPARAQAIKRLLPNAAVVHRTYSPHDPHWHDRRADGSWVFPPAQWIADHRGTVGNGVYLQVFNEPAPVNVDAFLTWLEECAAAAQGVPLALPAWAVGNPHDKDITAGKFDRLLRLVCGTPNALLTHEYFRDDPAAEYPWLCGRFEFWLDRAEALGLPPPTILVGEYGRDVAGGIADGWRDTGWTPTHYADLLIDTHRALYLPHGVRVMVFACGRGAASRWQPWNIEGEPDILNPIAEYNRMTQPPTDQRTAIASIALRLRPEPGTTKAAVTTIPEGAEITVWLSPVEAKEGYDWINAQWGDDKGWIILAYKGAPTFVVQALPEEPPPVDPDPPPIFSVWLTIDELRQSLALELEAAQLYDALKVNAQKRAALLQVAIGRAG